MSPVSWPGPGLGPSSGLDFNCSELKTEKKKKDITDPIDGAGNENRHRRFPIHLWSSPFKTNNKTKQNKTKV